MPVVGAVRIGRGEGGDLIRKNTRQRRLGHRDDGPAPSKSDLALAVLPHGPKSFCSSRALTVSAAMRDSPAREWSSVTASGLSAARPVPCELPDTVNRERSRAVGVLGQELGQVPG